MFLMEEKGSIYRWFSLGLLKKNKTNIFEMSFFNQLICWMKSYIKYVDITYPLLLKMLSELNVSV